MNGYHCLRCGEKLKQLSMNLSTDKYECPKCCTTWYRVRHIIIIRTLQSHYGFTCPVWIDNRESVVQIPEMDCQIISLIVSEKDKKLRIKLAEREELKEVV